MFNTNVNDENGIIDPEKQGQLMGNFLYEAKDYINIKALTELLNIKVSNGENNLGLDRLNLKINSTNTSENKIDANKNTNLG